VSSTFFVSPFINTETDKQENQVESNPKRIKIQAPALKELVDAILPSYIRIFHEFRINSLLESIKFLIKEETRSSLMYESYRDVIQSMYDRIDFHPLVVEEDPPSENKRNTFLMERYNRRIKARLNLVREIVTKEFYNLWSQDWISHDQWSFKKEVDTTKKSVQNFQRKSESLYSLWGGISDAFASEGGISVACVGRGPDVTLIRKFHLISEFRSDLRGYNSYRQYSRDLISCWSMSALAWSLKKWDFSVSLTMEKIIKI